MMTDSIYIIIDRGAFTDIKKALKQWIDLYSDSMSPLCGFICSIYSLLQRLCSCAAVFISNSFYPSAWDLRLLRPYWDSIVLGHLIQGASLCKYILPPMGARMGSSSTWIKLKSWGIISNIWAQSKCFCLIVLSLDAQRKNQRKCTTEHNFDLSLRPLHKPPRHGLSQSSLAPWTAPAQALKSQEIPLDPL